MERLLLTASLALALAAPAAAAAGGPGPTPPDALVLNNTGFLTAHPDLRWRRAGQAALEDGRDAHGFTFFRRAARYADKASQAMVAEMLWTGRGVQVDRALAYAWMDIAAERAYVPFVVKREQYWDALDETERARALAVGRPLFEEYRDAVAKKRLERELKRARQEVTGSRTGVPGFLSMIIAGPAGTGVRVDGESFYADRYWRPEQYWAWQDSIWKQARTGRVDVQPLEVVGDGDADAGDAREPAAGR